MLRFWRCAPSLVPEQSSCQAFSGGIPMLLGLYPILCFEGINAAVSHFEGKDLSVCLLDHSDGWGFGCIGWA